MAQAQAPMPISQIAIVVKDIHAAMEGLSQGARLGTVERLRAQTAVAP